MHKKLLNTLKLAPVLACFLATTGHAADIAGQSNMKALVDRTIQPLKEKFNIPGMAIAITANGRSYFYNYGVMSKESRKPVTTETLFEVGSLSKTFAATLAAYAQANGKVSLSDSVTTHLPELRGSSFDNMTLLNLGTHTSGLPLFMPDDMTSTDQLMRYLREWKLAHPAGTRRVYSNIGTGLFGMIAATSLQMPYEKAVEEKLLRPLGMTSSYFTVPAHKMAAYAQGYTTKDLPVRLNAGLLGAEAYGIKTTAPDLLKFVNANLQPSMQPKVQPEASESTLQRAIAATHTGYFKTDAFIQGLMWERYAHPAPLQTLLTGNANTIAFQELGATKLDLPLQSHADALINKTGSTNGFAAYVAFVPSRQIGIVILANKNYPADQRVAAAHQILAGLKK